VSLFKPGGALNLEGEERKPTVRRDELRQWRNDKKKSSYKLRGRKIKDRVGGLLLVGDHLKKVGVLNSLGGNATSSLERKGRGGTFSFVTEKRGKTKGRSTKGQPWEKIVDSNGPRF